MSTRLRCLLFLSLLLSEGFHLQAQQRPYYSQYVLNPFVSNPALSGIENYWDVKLSYRNQWNGISDAPNTIYATAHGPLKMDAQTSETSSTSHRYGKKSTIKRKTKAIQITPQHGGIGFSLVSDKAGPIEMYSFNATYAYHINLSAKTSLSTGVGCGVQGIYVRADKLNFGTTNPIDPAVNNAMSARTIKPDMSLGIWLYSAFYFVGVSTQNILPVEAAYSNDADKNGRLVTHASLIAGYKVYVNDDVNFVPSAMIRYVPHAPLNFDINTKFQFREVAWIGVSYRHSENFAAMMGMNINTSLSFGYSYDITTSTLKKSSNGSHEVIVGILLAKRNRVILSPRNFW
jgi:type IX secretion system PorP/SprF family membrane protein